MIGVEPASGCVCVRVCPCVHTFKYILNDCSQILCEASLGGKAALGFGADRFRTLVSMATGSSHWVIVATFSWLFFIRSFSYLQLTMTGMRAQMCSKFDPVQPMTAELAVL